MAPFVFVLLGVISFFLKALNVPVKIDLFALGWAFMGMAWVVGHLLS